MHKTNKLLPFLPVALLSLGTLAGCSNDGEEKLVLRVLNCEDYIYEYEEGDEEYAVGDFDYQMDMMDQFVEYWANTHDGQKISYVYDTFDTNETMFNELKTGKTTYDVIVPSDYMIQKLLSTPKDGSNQSMLHKLTSSNLDNLWCNISGFLVDKFNNITAVNPETNESESIYNYAIPYMWGTVGVMYNPNFYMERGLDEDRVHELFEDWDSLYGEELAGTFSIKDSVRDTYAVSLVHTFEKNGEINENIDNETLTSIFNRNDEDTMALVKEDMTELKYNAFGFECDSGKTDMTTQKIGANMCWSGDATWAITEARDNEIDLYYSVPTSHNGVKGKGASNIWFDGLCMPANAADENNLTDAERAQYELGEAFIEFMSMPENAAQNCYCVGYTPGAAGDEMLDYMRSCYDIPTMIEEQEETLSTLKSDLAELELEEFSEYLEENFDKDEIIEYLEELKSVSFSSKDVKKNFQGIVETYLSDLIDYVYDDANSAYLELKNDYEANKNDPTKYVEYNLNYFFDDEEGNDTIIADADTAKRELAAQYPSEDILDRLAIMNDFGPEGNARLLDMWESVRTNPLPIWGVVVLVIEALGLIGFLTIRFTNKYTRKQLKKVRN